MKDYQRELTRPEGAFDARKLKERVEFLKQFHTALLTGKINDGNLDLFLCRLIINLHNLRLSGGFLNMSVANMTSELMGLYRKHVNNQPFPVKLVPGQEYTE